MKYAVTAATGKFGKAALKELLKHISENSVVALARNVDKAQELFPQLEVRAADYADIYQMTNALQGVERLLFVSSQPGQDVARLQQHKSVLEAAENAEVKYIAYLSYPHAQEAASPLASDHKKTEKLLKKTGIKHSFLRNNWYLQNESWQIAQALAGEPFVYAAGDHHVGWALEQEYAQAAARVLLTKDPQTVYEFSGPSKTYAELAAALKKVSGKEFEVRSLNDEEFLKYLQDKGFSKSAAGGMLGIQELIKEGELAQDSGDLAKVLHHPLPSIEDSLKELLKN